MSGWATSGSHAIAASFSDGSFQSSIGIVLAAFFGSAGRGQWPLCGSEGNLASTPKPSLSMLMTTYS